MAYLIYRYIDGVKNYYTGCIGDYAYFSKKKCDCFHIYDYHAALLELSKVRELCGCYSDIEIQIDRN